MIIQQLCYLYDFALSFKALMKSPAFVDIHELIDAHIHFLESLLSGQVYSSTDRHRFYSYDFWAPVLQDV